MCYTKQIRATLRLTHSKSFSVRFVVGHLGKSSPERTVSQIFSRLGITVLFNASWDLLEFFHLSSTPQDDWWTKQEGRYWSRNWECCVSINQMIPSSFWFKIKPQSTCLIQAQPQATHEHTEESHHRSRSAARNPANTQDESSANGGV